MTIRVGAPWIAALVMAGVWQGVVRGDNETRRGVGSRSIDEVFDLTGLNVVMGQSDGVATPHIDVTNAAWYTMRGTDAPAADGGGSLHGLEVAAIMIGRNATEAGMAPAATLKADNIGNNGQVAGGGGAASENDFLDSLRFMMMNPAARVVNYSAFIAAGLNPNAMTKATLGLDYLITRPRFDGGDFLFVKSTGNSGVMPLTVPGDNFNGLSVGALTSEEYQLGTRVSQGPTDHRWGVLANFSNWGTNTTISKPDLVATGGRVDTDDMVGTPGNPNANRRQEIGLLMATGDILPANGYAASANGAGGRTNPGGAYVGTSYAAPHVSGIAAQLYQLAPATDHKMMKAVLMNAADKTVRGATHEAGPVVHGTFWRANDPPWTAGTNGLDAQLGAGAVDAWGAAANLQAGGVARIGKQEGGLTGGNATTDVITINNVGPDARIVATVAWDRRVNVDAVAVPGETYTVDANQAKFDLLFNRQGGGGVSVTSTGGSVAHLNQVLAQDGNYTLQLKNTGNSANATQGEYAVAWAVSPPDVNPNTQQPVYFTVRDQIHRPRAERTAPTGNDRIVEGRQLMSTVNVRAGSDAAGFAIGVDSSIYKSTFNASTTTQRTGGELGLMERDGVLSDDHVNDISFGNDGIRALYENIGTGGGGQIYFSVDTYATGLSPLRPNNPQTNGVYSESTIVNEAAGDIFVSSRLEPNRPAITNGNAKNRNRPDTDFLGPAGAGANANANSTYADSYYMGLVGGRVADNEDDVTGLEGLGGKIYDALHTVREGYYFFTLDRDSPSGHLGEVLVAREDTPNQFRTFATAGQLGLANTDNIDGLCVQWDSNLAADGWPVYNTTFDRILFSVDRDSTGANATAVRTESEQGEVASDLFFALGGGGNLLFLEGTDLGLQEFGFTNSYNWLTDNLDALDIADTTTIRPGDYNGDGKVDGADYVMWRKNPAAFGGNPAGYNTWRANFGAGSGSGLGSVAAVPEPTAAVLLLFGCAALGWRHRNA